MGNLSAKNKNEGRRAPLPSPSHATTKDEEGGPTSDNQPYSEIVIHLPIPEEVSPPNMDFDENDESFVFVGYPTRRRSLTVSSAEDAMIWSDPNTRKCAGILSGESMINVDSEHAMNKHSDSSSKNGKENLSDSSSKNGKENFSDSSSKNGKENLSGSSSKDGKRNLSDSSSKDGKENLSGSSSKDGKENPQKDLDRAVFGTASHMETHTKLHFDRNHSRNITSNSEPKPSLLRSKIQESSAPPDEFSPHEDSKTEKQHWIKVTGSGLTLVDVYEIFSHYGCISALAETMGISFVRFTNWVGVTNVLNEAKSLQETYKFDSVTVGEDEPSIKDPDRKEIYLGLPSFVLAYLKSYDELSKMMRLTTMAADDNVCVNVPKIRQLCDYIKSEISKEFPQSKLLPFGGHILGSSGNEEPIEIFVDVGNMYAGCHKQSIEEQVDISKDIRKYLSKDTGITWYSPEECPVGAFYHKQIRMNCTLSYDNGLADRSTQLLKVFMDYDDRFRVLYLTIDQWSRDGSLQGVKNGLNSYIVAILLVFYLQSPPVSILPSIQRIRAARPIIIKGWDCSFAEDPNMFPRNECSAGLHFLLRGFFLFYGSYDWKRVICPALGHSIDRRLFSDSSLPLPEDPVLANYCRAIYENHPNTPVLDINTCMCVQDFFNLSANISKGIPSDILLRFRSLCRQSYQMLHAVDTKMTFGPQSLYHPLNERRRHHLMNIPPSWRAKIFNELVMRHAVWENAHGADCQCEYCRSSRSQVFDCIWDNGRRRGYQQNFQVRQTYRNYDGRGDYRYRLPEGVRNNRSREAYRGYNGRPQVAYDVKLGRRNPQPTGSYDRRAQNGWEKRRI